MDILQGAFEYLFQPSLVSLGFGVFLAIVVVLMLAWKGEAVVRACARVCASNWAALKPKLLTRTGFYRVVIFVFLAVSCLRSGIFFAFGGNGSLGFVETLLGFSVALFFDLITVFLMEAFLEASAQGLMLTAWRNVLFIAATAGASTYANFAIASNNFSGVRMLPNAPTFIQQSATLVLSAFPLFIIMFTIASDTIVGKKKAADMNEVELRKAESDKVRRLEIRNEYLQKQVNAEHERTRILAERRAERVAVRGQFVRWLFPRLINLEALKGQIASGIEEAMRETYEQRLKAALFEQRKQFELAAMTAQKAPVTRQSAPAQSAQQERPTPPAVVAEPPGGEHSAMPHREQAPATHKVISMSEHDARQSGGKRGRPPGTSGAGYRKRAGAQ